MTDAADLLIAGGTLVDGTGAPGRPGRRGRDGRSCAPCPATTSTSPRPGRIDATGLVVAPGFIDLHSHGGLADPRRPAPRAEGPPGRDDRAHRRRWQRLCAVPEARRPARRSSSSTAASTGGRTSPRLVDSWRVPRPLRRRGHGQHRPPSSATARCASAPSAGTTCAATPRAHRPTMRAALREAMEDGAFGRRSGLDYPPGRSPRPTSWQSSPTRRHVLGGIYHTHVRYPLGDRFLDPFREAIEIGRRGERPSTSPTSITARRSRAAGAAPRARRRGARRGPRRHVRHLPIRVGSTRLLIQLPPWVQAGGPVPSRSVSRIPASAPASAPSCARAVPPTPRPRAGPTCALAPSPTRAPALGGPRPSPTSCATRATTRSMCSATSCWRSTSASCRLPRARAPTASAASCATRRDGRHGLDLLRRQAGTPHLRLLPARSSASSFATRACSPWRRRCTG